MISCTLGLLFLLAGLLGRAATAVDIDNAVVGLPEVDCMDEMVKMKFKTERPFTGRIFVKGMVDKQQCVTKYTTNSDGTVTYELKNGACNMRRQRRLGPQKGIEQSMTIIVSFHETFITKVDRAYRCTCFFMEADKIVTSSLEVSMLPTVDLIDTARMPLCTYSVRSGSVDGPLMSHAKIGERAFHVWQCDSDMFGMLVHSCTVDDGSGQGRFQLLDNHGCAVDPVILTDLSYKPEANEASVEAPVFKFADKATIYFQCSISLCMKNDGACLRVTPPVCNRTRATRVKRELSIDRNVSSSSSRRHLTLGMADMDVTPGSITVLDLDDDLDGGRAVARREHSYESEEAVPMFVTRRRYQTIATTETDSGVSEVCIQTTAFIGGLVSTMILVLIAASGVLYFYLRRFSSKLRHPSSIDAKF